MDSVLWSAFNFLDAKIYTLQKTVILSMIKHTNKIYNNYWLLTNNDSIVHFGLTQCQLFRVDIVIDKILETQVGVEYTAYTRDTINL